MLVRIMADIASAGRPLCVAELSRDLHIDQDVLRGMLETLLVRGRLRAIPPDASACGACPVKAGCFILSHGLATTYTLSTDRASDVQGGQA